MNNYRTTIPCCAVTFKSSTVNLFENSCALASVIFVLQKITIIKLPPTRNIIVVIFRHKPIQPIDELIPHPSLKPAHIMFKNNKVQQSNHIVNNDINQITHKSIKNHFTYKR